MEYSTTFAVLCLSALLPMASFNYDSTDTNSIMVAFATLIVIVCAGALVFLFNKLSSKDEEMKAG